MTRRLGCGAALAGLCVAAPAQSPPDGRWHGDISIGGAASPGSTSATTINLRAEASRTTDIDKLGLSALVNDGRSKANGVTTRSADLARVCGRYDRNLNEHYFVFGGGEVETNKVGGVSSRRNANVGAGWHVWRSDTLTWDLFAGPGYATTRFTDGSRRAGVEWLVGEESSHRLGESAHFKQRLVLYPAGGGNGSRATFDANLTTAISGVWTFNTGWALRHTSKVPAGSPKTERVLSFGVGYKF
jgi:putative salt-induced outer membrane protein